MTISKELLELLVCPLSKQEVSLCSPESLEALNRYIGEGSIESVSGKKVLEPVDGALICEDKKRLYIIRKDIPIMLSDEAIDTTNLELPL